MGNPLLGAQPAPVRDAFNYCLALMMVEAGKMRLMETVPGEKGIAAPVIVTTTFGSVNVIGTACAGCTVEVFGNEDSAGEGQTYLGETIADASGDLPDPDVLALETVEDLQAALEQISEIAEDLEAADG